MRDRRIQAAPDSVVFPLRIGLAQGWTSPLFKDQIKMPANPFNALTDYGIGIGLRIPHYRHILERKPVVDSFQSISETDIFDGGKPLRALDQILEQYRAVRIHLGFRMPSARVTSMVGIPKSYFPCRTPPKRPISRPLTSAMFWIMSKCRYSSRA